MMEVQPAARKPCGSCPFVDGAKKLPQDVIDDVVDGLEDGWICHKSWSPHSPDVGRECAGSVAIGNDPETARDIMENRAASGLG